MSTPDLARFAVEAVLADSNHIVVVLDTEMVVRWLSPSAAKYGFDAMGKSVVELAHPEDLDTVASAFEAADLIPVVGPSLLANSIVSVRILTLGGYMPCDASGRWVADDSDGADRWWLVVVLHEARTRFAVDRALKTLVAGASEQESIEAIIDAVHDFGGVVGAQLLWSAGDGRAHTSGDLGAEVGQVVAALGTPDPWPTRLTPLPVNVDGSAWGFTAPVASQGTSVGTLVVWGKGQAPNLDFAWTALGPVTDLAALTIERARRQAELEHRATTDRLTGLLNRHAFFHALEQPSPSTAVMYVDLDEFKAVNDEHGHTTGDRLLSVVAKRLVDAVREHDVVSRIGGDEFAVLCRSITCEQAALVAGRVVESLNQTFAIDGRRIATGASVGVAYAEQAIDGRVMLDQADQALLAAKAEGKGCSSLLVI